MLERMSTRTTANATTKKPAAKKSTASMNKKKPAPKRKPAA
jgi:hypothetical protein